MSLIVVLHAIVNSVAGMRWSLSASASRRAAGEASVIPYYPGRMSSVEP